MSNIPKANYKGLEDCACSCSEILLFVVKLRCQSSYNDELQGGGTAALVCREIPFASSRSGYEHGHNAAGAHSKGADCAEEARKVPHAPARTCAQEYPQHPDQLPQRASVCAIKWGGHIQTAHWKQSPAHLSSQTQPRISLGEGSLAWTKITPAPC